MPKDSEAWNLGIYLWLAVLSQFTALGPGSYTGRFFGGRKVSVGTGVGTLWGGVLAPLRGGLLSARHIFSSEAGYDDDGSPGGFVS